MGVYSEVTDPRYRYLKAFQCKRLADTYADFSLQPEYEQVSRFFFTRIYSTDDTSARDKAFKKVHQTLERFFSGDWLQSLTRLVDLQRLTIEMDLKLLRVLDQLSAPREFDMGIYEEAYFRSDNFDQRVRQIELLDFTLRRIHRIAHTFGVGLILRAAKAACLVLGDTRMVDFLMEGYRTFSGLKDIDPFASAVCRRETRRLHRIYRKG